MSDFATIVAAALWGAAAGALLPRAAYRFSAPAGEPWRHLCPAGHPVRGWLGPAHCAACAPPPGAPRPRPTEDTPPPERHDTVTEGAGADGAVTEGAGADGAGAKGAGTDGAGAEGVGADGAGAKGAGTDNAGAEGTGTDGAGAKGAGAEGVGTEGKGADGPYPGRPAANGPDTGSDGASEGRSLWGVGAACRYGPRVAALAAVTALLCAGLAAATGTRPELGVWLLLAPLGVLLAVVDFRVRRLPDPLTLPLAAAALGLLALAALVPEHAGHWLTALYGALALGGGYFVLFLINPGGMGFGDVKLALGAGAALGWYGWPTLMLGTFAGFLFGAVYAAALVAGRRADRKTAIPFGPFLIAGAYAGVLIGAYAA